MSSWAALSLVSDAEIGQLEPQAVASGSPWGAVTWAAARAEAKNDLEIWIEADHPGIPGVSDLVSDRWEPSYVLSLISGTFADLTSEARDDTVDDLDLEAIFATPNTDRLYVGAAYQFDGVFLAFLETINATASVLTVKYFHGGAWTDISDTDGTTSGGATFAKSGEVTWTVPTDWERRDLDDTGQEYYWVELSVTVQPDTTLATQVLCIQPPKALKRIAAWLALYHIMNGLAAQTPDADFWQVKADAYLEMATALYARVTIPIDLDRSGGVSDQESQTAAQGPVRMFRA